MYIGDWISKLIITTTNMGVVGGLIFRCKNNHDVRTE